MQAYSQPKMGWMVQVVDGGLSDMYSKSVLLSGSKQLTLFWTLTATDISVAVRGERPSGYLAIAFGRSVAGCLGMYLGKPRAFLACAPPVPELHLLHPPTPVHGEPLYPRAPLRG